MLPSLVSKQGSRCFSEPKRIKCWKERKEERKEERNKNCSAGVSIKINYIKTWSLLREKNVYECR